VPDQHGVIDGNDIIEPVRVNVADFSVPDGVFVDDHVLERYLAGKSWKNKEVKATQD
jgi:hypothetical protein